MLLYKIYEHKKNKAKNKYICPMGIILSKYRNCYDKKNVIMIIVQNIIMKRGKKEKKNYRKENIKKFWKQKKRIKN